MAAEGEGSAPVLMAWALWRGRFIFSEFSHAVARRQVLPPSTG